MKIIKDKSKQKIIREIIQAIPPYSEELVDVSEIKRKYLDLDYCNIPNSKKLDIYLPDQGEGPFPVLIHLHGGGFIKGNKRDIQLKLPLKARDIGFAIVSVDYSKSYEANYPKLVHEIKTSIRYLRSNAEKYRLNPQKIFVIGCSAGGHLASLIGTSEGIQALEGGQYGYVEYSSGVQGAISFCGSSNFLTMQHDLSEHLRKLELNAGMIYGESNSIDTLLFGKLVKSTPELAKEFSSLTYVSKNIPEFLIVHGTHDNYVAPKQSIDLVQKIKEVGVGDKVELHLLDGIGHCNKAFFSYAIPIMLKFLEKMNR
ncbi:alpha/beta hydrolase fold domain-containing protein [Bacillus cereus]|uniref:alpha/beta hydrolase fold domain-containing protein n=1 Tax=Bacillus cereus TaxID=1396 RepID=UPI003D96ED83